MVSVPEDPPPNSQVAFFLRQNKEILNASSVSSFAVANEFGEKTLDSPDVGFVPIRDAQSR